MISVSLRVFRNCSDYDWWTLTFLINLLSLAWKNTSVCFELKNWYYDQIKINRSANFMSNCCYQCVGGRALNRVLKSPFNNKFLPTEFGFYKKNRFPSSDLPMAGVEPTTSDKVHSKGQKSVLYRSTTPYFIQHIQNSLFSPPYHLVVAILCC